MNCHFSCNNDHRYSGGVESRGRRAHAYQLATQCLAPGPLEAGQSNHC